MTPIERRKLAKQCKELWFKRSLEMWGAACEICGYDWQLAFHHFITKSRCSNLAFDPKNSVPLCKPHHYAIHFSKDTLAHRKLEDAIINRRGKEWLRYITKQSKVKGLKTNRLWYEGWIKRLR